MHGLTLPSVVCAISRALLYFFVNFNIPALGPANGEPLGRVWWPICHFAMGKLRLEGRADLVLVRAGCDSATYQYVMLFDKCWTKLGRFLEQVRCLSLNSSFLLRA